MMAIWYIDMPRARTQSGRPIWADTLSVLAVVIQAMPAAHGRHGHQALGAKATTAMAAPAAACRAAPARRAMVLAQARQNMRGHDGARAHGGQQQREGAGAAARQPRATSGSSASSAVECRKNSEMRSSTPCSGGLAHELQPHAHRAAQALAPQRVRRVHALPAHDDETPRPPTARR
jgi:hypothetical protein